MYCLQYLSAIQVPEDNEWLSGQVHVFHEIPWPNGRVMTTDCNIRIQEERKMHFEPRRVKNDARESSQAKKKVSWKAVKVE